MKLLAIVGYLSVLWNEEDGMAYVFVGENCMEDRLTLEQAFKYVKEHESGAGYGKEPIALEGSCVQVRELPKCNVPGCSSDARFDAKTVIGQWGYLCEKHFNQLGAGIGIGLGQALVTFDEMK
jgi:hypothetical protein